MSKSIYSLVLSDEVVAKADELAYQMHTSRSNLINQILAEHLSCVTPEMRMQAVFSGMEAMIQQFRILEQASANMMALQSQLNYKYKPTVQYFVELNKSPEDGRAGILRIRLRTQNPVLITTLKRFFQTWISWERDICSIKTEYQLFPGRLERVIFNPNVDEETFGQLLGEYVQRFDKYLKAWFSGTEIHQLEAAFQKEAAQITNMI